MSKRTYEVTVLLKGCKQREADRIAIEIAERYWPRASVVVAYGDHKYAIVQAQGQNEVAV